MGATSAVADTTVKWDTAKLDDLLEQARINVLLVSSRHNLRHLLDGYQYFLYRVGDPIGLSRYQPLLGYPRGRLDIAFYVGAGNERWGVEAEPLWVPDLINGAWSSEDAAITAAAELRRRGYETATVGVELSFLAGDALRALERELPGARFVDAASLLEELRAVKRADELEHVRAAAEGIVASMLTTFSCVRVGMTKREIVERFRSELTSRGLTFEYCLVAAGKDLNRAPSSYRLPEGGPLSLDSGGEAGGFIGDVARIAVVGEPTAELVEALAAVDRVQQAARSAIQPGRRGGDIFSVAEQALAQLSQQDRMGFLAHGMGRATHEVPRLTSTGSPPYPATHAERPLEPGMVISVETHLADARIGFVKLEDVLIVTKDGHEAVADVARGWNLIGV